MSGEVRDTWNNQLDFLLSIIGFAVDLSNVWRFPYLVYVNGGGAFLIPYFLLLILAVLPAFYMELLLGQMQRESSISVWKICPFFKGIGVSQLLVNMTVSFYYNVIIGWCLYYLFCTITSNLPWMRCDPGSTQFCVTAADLKARNVLKANYTAQNMTWPPPNMTARAQLPSQEYFERQVLSVQESGGFAAVGLPKWELAVCTGMVYTIVFFCLWKGIKSSGKVVYITALFPYILLLVILVQGCLLEGSLKGIKYFIIPDFNKLLNGQVWLAAAVQIFYSVGSGFGVHITLASFNRPSSNCLRNCLITAGANSFASLLAGFTVFTYLGYMSGLTGQDISEVANEGPGLVFQVYPLAVGSLPAAPLWSIIFFILVIMLGIDSTMGGLESIITGLRDEFRGFCIRHRWFSHELTTFLVILVSFLVSLVTVTKGGIFVLQLLDRLVGIPLVLAALFQSVAIAWFYGMSQFCSDVRRSCGYVPNIVWRICWKLITPAFILVVVVFSLKDPPPLSYRFGAYHPELSSKIKMSEKLDYQFPDWATIVFWSVSGLQMFMIPLFMLIAVIRYRSFYLAVSPESEHYDLKYGLKESVRRKVIHWFSFGPLRQRDEEPYSLPYESRHGHDNRAIELQDACHKF